MYQYHGYWFYGLRNDEIIQAKNLMEEYCILNCPQEYEGPFTTQDEAYNYYLTHPNLHKNFIKNLEEMERYYFG